MAEPEERSPVSRAPRGVVRSRMVEGAVRLLATKGVEGTSFAEVLEATDSPRGSVYHHFPGGKPELLHAALDLASERGRGNGGHPGTTSRGGHRALPRAVARPPGLFPAHRRMRRCRGDRRSQRRRSPRSCRHDLSNLDGTAHWPLSGRRRGHHVSPIARRDRNCRHRGSSGSLSSGAKHGTLRGRSQRPDVPSRERLRPVSLDCTTATDTHRIMSNHQRRGVKYD